MKINRKTSNYHCPKICRHCRYFARKTTRENEGYCEKWEIKSKRECRVLAYWTCDYQMGPPK